MAVWAISAAACASPFSPDNGHTRTRVLSTGIVLSVGESTNLRLMVNDGRDTYTLPPTARPWPEAWTVDWTSSNAAALGISQTGRASAFAAGHFTITATVSGRYRDTASVTVLANQDSSAILFRSISTGSGITCGVSTGAEIFCWGGNSSGELGIGAARKFTATVSAVRVPGLRDMSGVAAGTRHVCAVSQGGAAFCWGDNLYGQLGDGTQVSRVAPTKVALARRLSAISAGNDHTCALDDSGAAFCWGRGFGVQPALVPATTRLVRLSAGGYHTCAISDARRAFCWGSNQFGQLGTGDFADRQTPTGVDTTSSFESISSGVVHTCGITVSRQLRCWGDNRSGRLGTGSQASSAIALSVASDVQWREVDAGLEHTCGVAVSGSAWCWGGNIHGQLGNDEPFGSGTLRAENLLRAAPVPVAGRLQFASISASPGDHSCGIAVDGKAYCWGWNAEGQLGVGNNDSFHGTSLPLLPFPGLVRPWPGGPT